MQGSSNRSTVVISGLLTLLLLGGTTLAVGFHNGWLRTISDTPTPAAVGARTPPSDNRPNDLAVDWQVGAGDERLTEHDGDDDHRERSRRRNSDDN